MPIAVASFVLDSFDEEPAFLEDPGVRYSRIRIVKTFSGDIEAHSTVEMLSVRRRERWRRLRGSGTDNGFSARQVR